MLYTNVACWRCIREKVSYRQSKKNQKDTRYKILFCKIHAIPLDTQKSIADTCIGDTLPILPSPGEQVIAKVNYYNKITIVNDES